MRRLFPIQWLLFALMMLMACAHQSPRTHHYVLGLEGAATADTLPTLSVTVALADFRAVPGLEGQELAYMPATHELAYYAYHRWVASPARLLAQRLGRALQHSQAFDGVVWDGRPVAADYLLRGRITAFHEEDAAEGWYSVLGVDLELERTHDRARIWSHSYRLRRRTLENTPAAVVFSLAESVDALSADVVRDLYAALTAESP
jgi:ABC-type uncharacterized transport system auxiliary subunit